MSTVAKKEKMSVRHMLVVLTGIMITFGCSALCFSTWGLFQPVVAEGLGVETTAFAMYVTVMYLTMTVASPFMGKLLQTVDIRIILSVSACLVGGAFLLMSVSNEIWMFYLAAVFTGLRAGGMDFHTIYLIWAVIALVTSLPFTLFCVRSKPEDCGLAPYGASVVAGQAPAKPTGLSAAAAMKTPAFYFVCVFAGLINIAVLIAMQFTTYTKSLTDVAFDVLVVGGVMTTVMMVGQALFKLILGVVADRNAKGALVFAFVCGVAGVLLCWFGIASEYILYSGAFIFGAFYATAVVLVPVIVRQSFGSRDYSVIYSRVSTVFNLIAAFASMIWAWIGSSFGFNAVFIVGLVLLVLILLLGFYTFANAKKFKSQWTE